MASEENLELHEHTDQEARELFNRFSFPILRPCITPHQKKVAVGIAKILWLRLVTGTDTETNIYQDLKGILGDKHDAIVGVGSMYFFKMKTALMESEIRRLKNHFRNEANFSRLKGWAPTGPGRSAR